MERIVFVCDNFADKYIGGAELSLQSHIDTCPYPSVLVRSSAFNPKKFNPKKDFLVFGNYAALDRKHFGEIATRFRYVIEECDYKYCRFRSSHKHKAMEGRDCDCHLTAYGLDVFAFMRSAAWVFWKSERQRDEYLRLFGHPAKPLNVDQGGAGWALGMIGTIVGGVFSDADLDYLESLREVQRGDKWFVLYSTSWIKGYNNAASYCRTMGLKAHVVGNIPYRDCLNEMSKCVGMVYLPNGFDVSCRMVTEAKVMGLKIITNELVQHTTESWFKGSSEERMSFLRSRNPEFWRVVREVISRAA